MKIGIIIHSNTGNTLTVGQRLEKELTARGHTAVIERVTSENDASEAANIVLDSKPDVDTYDMIILGAPVHAFSLSVVMMAYLEQLTSLSGKKVFCFVTQALPKPWLGGNRAIKTMKRLCAEKGAEPFNAGVVNWGSKQKETQIEDIVACACDIKP